MWIVRILNGAQKNQVFPLKLGMNSLGRGPDCQVILSSQRVSKKHAQIMVTGDKLIFEDLKSRNGSLVNGVKVQQKLLQLGDLIHIDEFSLEIAQIDEMQLLQNLQAPPPQAAAPAAASQMQPFSQESLKSPDLATSPPESEPQSHGAPARTGGLLARILAYLDEVVLPGVYKMGRLYDFRWVLGAFVLGFVVLATVFSVVPMNKVTSENIQNESKRRALTIAKNLALMNHQAVLQKLHMSLTTRLADLEPGVESALIIASDNGIILAPPQRAGSFASDPFIQRVRQESKERVEMISRTRIAATVPISAFDTELGLQTVRAHAVIFYNMEKSAIDAEQALSLYIQSTLVALLLGGVLYFFLFRLIQHPAKVLNEQLDEILAGERHDLHLEFKNRELVHLSTQINSLLARSTIDSKDGALPESWVSKDQEAQKICDLTGWASLAFDPTSSQFIACNDSFLDLGFSNGTPVGQGVENLLDPALKESLKELLVQLDQGALQASHNLPLQGHEMLEVRAQKIHLGGGQDQDFVVVVFLPIEDFEEAAG